MKLYAIIIVLLLSIKTASQNICGKINYTHKTDFAYVYIEKYKMTFNNTVSYSIEQDVLKHKTKKEKEISEDKVTTKYILGRSNRTPKFYYKTLNDTYFSYIWDKELFIVKENPFLWQWQLKPATKEIGGFICNEASIHFRGRDYTAWYTTQIPVPFGPWKFKGLPGLILEVYEKDYKLHITTTKIKVEKCTENNIKIDKKSIKKAITIKKLQAEKEILIEKEFAKLSSRLPKGSKPLKIDKNCEDCKQKGLEIFDEED